MGRKLIVGGKETHTGPRNFGLDGRGSESESSSPDVRTGSGKSRDFQDSKRTRPESVRTSGLDQDVLKESGRPDTINKFLKYIFFQNQ